MFLSWRWYKGFYVGKQACHAKLNCLYRTFIFHTCSDKRYLHKWQWLPIVTVEVILCRIVWVFFLAPMMHEFIMRVLSLWQQVTLRHWWYLSAPFSMLKGMTWWKNQTCTICLAYPRYSFAPASSFLQLTWLS